MRAWISAPRFYCERRGDIEALLEAVVHFRALFDEVPEVEEAKQEALPAQHLVFRRSPSVAISRGGWAMISRRRWAVDRDRWSRSFH